MNAIDFSKILQNVSLENYVSQYTTLKKVGKHLVGLCPLHDEKTPSFNIWRDNEKNKDVFYCHGCKRHGDAHDFICAKGMEKEEAWELLAKNAGVEFGKSIDNKNYIFAELQQYFISQKFQKANEYLINERKFDSQTIQDFGLGFCPHNFADFTKKFTQTDVEPLRIIENNGYSYLKNTITIPIRNSKGKITSFTAKSFLLNDKRAKYVNSHNTDYYKKSEILFGLDLAKEQIRKENFVYLVEGHFDVMRHHQIGLKNTIGICGSSISEAQLEIIRNYTNQIVLCFDGDLAGLESTKKIAIQAIQNGLLVDYILLPSKEKKTDPDKYCLELGTENYIDFLRKNKRNYITYIANSFAKKTDLTEKIKGYDGLYKIIMQVKNSTHKAFYISEIKKIFKIDYASNQITKRISNTEIVRTSFDQTFLSKIREFEKMILFYSLQYADLITTKNNIKLTIFDYFSEELFGEHKFFNTDLYDLLLDYNQKGFTQEHSNFCEKVISDSFIQIKTKIDQDLMKTFYSLIMNWKFFYLENWIEELDLAIRNNCFEFSQTENYKNIRKELIAQIFSIKKSLNA
jgi:DNA primase